MKKPLIVLIPGIKGDASSFIPLKKMLIEKTELSNALWLDFNYQEYWWSNKSLEVIARNLESSIENYIFEHKNNISHIILVGHSLGTTILRRALLNTYDSLSPSSSEPWVHLVTRVILMGSLGRGFDLNNLEFKKKLLLKPLAYVGRFFGFGKMRLSVLKGADFTSKLRIDWIHFNTKHKTQFKIVHLLGNNDQVVAPIDVIDLEQFPNVIPIGVPNSNHNDIIIPNEDTRIPLKKAFIDISSNRTAHKNEDSAKKVFFFLHGIRDSRKCFSDVAKELDNQTLEDTKIIVPSYRYLSIISFLYKPSRDKWVRWFIDEFAECLARNPSAKFYFSGHSNGTYMLGEALKKIPPIRFERIYIAGSVLPVEFDWNNIIYDNEQVDFVRSDMGSADIPVGILCYVLNRLGMKSIGSGGFEGFQFGDKDHISYNIFSGGHGSMLKDNNVESIVKFLLNNSNKELKPVEVKETSLLFTFFRKFGDIILMMTIASIIAVFFFMSGPIIGAISAIIVLLILILRGI